MKALLTGGGGFLIGVLAQRLLRNAKTHVTAVDTVTADPDARAFLDPGGDRLRWVTADVRRPEQLRRLLAGDVFDVVVHGAALSHVAEWETTRPLDYLDVNVVGTCALLDVLCSSPHRPRVFIHVSSCAVYGDGTPGVSVQPEAGPTAPGELYGISKLAGEQVVRRYSSLFDIPVVIVRPGKLFGPLERPSPSRALMSAPFLLARAAVGGGQLRVSSRTPDAALDWLSAADAADALMALSSGGGRHGATYNLGSGRRTPFHELVKVAEAHERRRLVVVDDAYPELDLDPSAQFGRDAASDITAITTELRWRPQPFAEQFRAYLRWAHEHPALLMATSPRAPDGPDGPKGGNR